MRGKSREIFFLGEGESASCVDISARRREEEEERERGVHVSVLEEQHFTIFLFICLLDGEISEKVTISRKFKERVVQPILKVRSIKKSGNVCINVLLKNQSP